jgi:hypothetical protein
MVITVLNHPPITVLNHVPILLLNHSIKEGRQVLITVSKSHTNHGIKSSTNHGIKSWLNDGISTNTRWFLYTHVRRDWGHRLGDGEECRTSSRWDRLSSRGILGRAHAGVSEPTIWGRWSMRLSSPVSIVLYLSFRASYISADWSRAWTRPRPNEWIYR